MIAVDLKRVLEIAALDAFRAKLNSGVLISQNSEPLSKLSEYIGACRGAKLESDLFLLKFHWIFVLCENRVDFNVVSKYVLSGVCDFC